MRLLIGIVEPDDSHEVPKLIDLVRVLVIYDYPYTVLGDDNEPVAICNDDELSAWAESKFVQWEIHLH